MSEEKYGLTWPGKKASIEEAYRPIDKMLIPCPEEGSMHGQTWNGFIKGDNLDALKLLSLDYKGKIKLIYIDPPYNTGSDFVWSDKFKNASGSTKESSHAAWLSMLYPRLLLARDLLTEDGSIFVNIDFNEVANLKLIMDEIFGEENFQREIIWRIGWLSGYKTMAPNFIRNHDSILFYSKNHEKLSFYKQYIQNEDFKPLVKKTKELSAKLSSFGLKREQQKQLLHFINHENRPERYPIEDTWNSNEYDDLNSIAIVSFSGEKVSKILGLKKDFKGQKSIKMLMRIIAATTKNDDYILDFFAGTASTAHAVWETNNQDSGNRRWIMVQRPDPLPEEMRTEMYQDLCDIGIRRLLTVSERYEDESKDYGIEVLQVVDRR